MDAVSKQIDSPHLLAEALAVAAHRLGQLLAADREAATSLRSVLPHLDLPLREEIQAQLAGDHADRLHVAAQLAVFGLLAASYPGRIDASACALRELPPLDELVAALTACDVQRILQRVQSKYVTYEPLAPFHELLLRAIDTRARRRRGVFYTPAPIVDWMVRGVATLLETHFVRDAHLRFIDPACGSGVFLSGVIERIQSGADAIDRRVSLVGLDVLPGSCAVARMLAQCCLMSESQRSSAPHPRPLSRQGRGENEVTLHIECVNPLLAGESLQPLVLGDDGALPVILGNPPYANFGRLNQSAWIASLLDDYKDGLKEKKLNLSDDFIKFFRWGQHWIDRAGRGVLALVTNRTYLDGLTHRGMRASLCRSFDEIHVLDLGGDVDAQRSHTSREADENVFGIRRGVAVGLFVKTGAGGTPRVRYHALRGTRAEKFDALDASVERNSFRSSSFPWQTLSPNAPAYDFVPRMRRSAEYRTWPRLVDMFDEYISGVQTKNDALLTDFDRDALAARIRGTLADVQRNEFRATKSGDGVEFDDACLRPYLVAPFDLRWIYYEPRIVGRARYSVMRHLLRPNLALVFMRQSTCEGEYDHFLATDALASDRVFYSTHGAPFLAPLWLYAADDDAATDDSTSSRRPNLNAAFAEEFAGRLERRYAPSAVDDGASSRAIVTPADIFHYAYGLFHGTDYRRRFHDELRIDFPRLPPVDPDHYVRLRDLGRRLVELHVRPADMVVEISASIPDAIWRIDKRFPRFEAEVRGRQVAKYTLKIDAAVAGGIWLNAELLLAGVSSEVWQFRLGGYDVLPRWLRQRRGRLLTPQDRLALLRLIKILKDGHESCRLTAGPAARAWS